MGVDIQIVGVDVLRKLLDDMPEELFENTKKQFNKSGLNIHRDITTPMKTGENGLQSRTGNLARSIKHNLSGNNLGTLGMEVFTKSIYSRIHEKGGTIRGKNKFLGLGRGPLLSIPTSVNKTAAGVTRMSPSAVFSAGGYIGMAYVFIPKQGLQNRLSIILNDEAMYTFAKQVTIKPTLNMVNTSVGELPTLLSNLNKTMFEGL